MHILWKYWWELNLVVEPKIAIATALADFNSAVRYGIIIHIIYASMKYWRIFNLAVAMVDHKLPNLIPCQIFQLYDTLFHMIVQ